MLRKVLSVYNYYKSFQSDSRMISFRMHLIIINLDCQSISWAGYYSNWIKWLLSAVWYVDSTAYLITILQRGCKYSACIKNTVLIWRWKIHVRHCWLTGMITFSYLCTFFQFLYAIILVAFLNEFFFNFSLLKSLTTSLPLISSGRVPMITKARNSRWLWQSQALMPRRGKSM